MRFSHHGLYSLHGVGLGIVRARQTSQHTAHTLLLLLSFIIHAIGRYYITVLLNHSLAVGTHVFRLQRGFGSCCAAAYFAPGHNHARTISLRSRATMITRTTYGTGNPDPRNAADADDYIIILASASGPPAEVARTSPGRIDR